MSLNITGDYMPALLISLVLLASIICGLVFVICAVVLCKFCYEKQKTKAGILTDDKKENIRNRRLPSEDIKLCRKLLNQSETTKKSEKIILKALDSDLDSSESNAISHIDACVQTDESSFLQNEFDFKYQISGCANTNSNQDKNSPGINYKIERISNSPPNQFKKPPHSKSRVKVQIQNYISPNNNSNSLQITQAVVRRFSDNSPYKDDEALETENYSRGRSASQIPQTNKMSPTPSVNRLNNELINHGQCLVTPATQRRGSHHLRPFDTHWGNSKLSHSMELVSTKPSISTEERKVHSFDNALGRRRAISSQGALFQAKSLTMSNSDEAASSSLEEPHNQPLLVTTKNEERYQERLQSPKLLHKNELPLNKVMVYNFTNNIPVNKDKDYKQRSYQNIMECSNWDNYKSRKSYVGEFNASPESLIDNRISNKKSSPQKERRVRRRARGISNRTQSSKDSITINIIDSDSEKQLLNDNSHQEEPRLSISDFYNSKIDPSLSPRSAAAKRHQFSRERQSLIQAADINEFHQMMESNVKQTQLKDSENWNNPKQFLERDYSVDERTSAIFNEFMRPDPKLDKNVMKAQILEKIRTQRKSTCSPIKTNDQGRLKLEYTKAASFASKDDFQNYTNTKEDEADTHLNFPKLTSYQQRRQSIGKLKVQSFDQKIQLPVIILPDESP